MEWPCPMHTGNEMMSSVPGAEAAQAGFPPTRAAGRTGRPQTAPTWTPKGHRNPNGAGR